MSDQNDKKEKKEPDEIPQNAKFYIVKCKNLESTINKLKLYIKQLSKRIIEISREKEDLKVTINNNAVISEEIINLKDELKNVRKQREEIVLQKDQEISNLTRKVSMLENKMQIDKSDFDKNIEIYSSKMNTVTYLQMDNEAYKDELEKMIKGRKELEAQKEEELKMARVKYDSKLSKFKEKMIDTLRKTNEDLKNFNHEFMGANNRLLLEQKIQLLNIIDEKNKIIKDLNKQIDVLREKINNDEKDQEIHKLVEYNLAYKLLQKNQNPLNKNKQSRKRNLFNNAQTLTKNQSEKNIYMRTTNMNNQRNKLMNNNINLQKSHSIEEIEQFPKTSQTNFIFSKQRKTFLKEMQGKNMEIEREKLINIQLRNKLNIYKSKFKGLVDFLEENLQSFSKDEKLMAKTNFNSKTEKLKKCEFDEFNQEEKKELLSILIKYLMPLANPEMDLSASNESKTYFNTNLSITKLKRVKNKNYLKDELLKKAFVNKANRYHQDIMTGKNLIFNSSKNDILDI